MVPSSSNTGIFTNFSLGIFTLLLFSCGEEPTIQSYVIPSEYEGPVVTWKLPADWGENPDLSGPMAGSFHVKSDLGPVGRIGIMPFRETVSTLDVANMFGKEMGYGLLSEDDLSELAQVRTIDGREFEWIRLVDKAEVGSMRTVLLALYRNEGETWLFPFIGDQPLINEQMKNFESFLSSTTLRAGKEKIRAKVPQPVPPASAHQAEGPTWDIPSHWQKAEASSMRLASYEVADKNGSRLDFSVTSFPGDVGGLLANVNRWLGQIGMEEVKENEIEKYVTEIIIDEQDAQLVVAEGEEQALYAAILMIEGRSWFFNISGDLNLAKLEKPNFLSFLDSVCFN